VENAIIVMAPTDTKWYRDGILYPAPPNFTSFPAGTYYANVKDDNCEATTNEITIIEYKPLGGWAEPTPATCKETGSIRINDPTGGDSRYLVPDWEDNEDLDPGLAPAYEYQVRYASNDEIVSGFDFKEYSDMVITGLQAGEYYVVMRHKDFDVACIPAVRIPLQTATPNFITINAISTIDLTDPSIWFETEDPECFNGNGKITVYNPVSDITENILFSIFDEEGNDVVWLALSEGAPEEEFNVLPVGKYSLDIEDKDNGCKIEAIPFEIGADLPQGEIKNISATLLGYDCATKSGYIEFDVFWDGTATPDVTCTHTENEEATLTGVYDGEKWQYRAELITSGVATITVSVTENSNTCTFDARTNDYTFPTDMTLTHDYTQGKGECDASTVDVKFTIAGGTGPYTLSGVGDEDVIVTANNYTANLEADTYHVKVTDDLGCYAEVNDLSIELRKPVDLLSVTPPVIIQESCKDKANGSFEFKDANYTYIWDKNNTPGPLLSGLSEGKYGVKITNADNCSADAEYEITIANKIEVSITGDGNGDGKNEYCPGSQATLTGEVLINDNPPMSGDANWRLPNNDRPDFIPDQPLQLTASNSTVKLEAFYNGCSGSAEFEIKTSPLPVIEFTKDAIYIPQGGEFELNVTAENFVSCSWTAVPDFGQTQDLECPPYAGILTSPDERYELTLTLENEYGCTVSKSIIVDQPLDFFIPNAFTPNGDLVHDTWVFRNIEQYTDSYDVQVKVFVRGGSPVFEGKGYNNSSVVWDGRRNGQDVPVGAYWYVVQLVPKSGKGETIRRTGSVTVIR
jgi:gliding motility-associated-like protein